MHASEAGRQMLRSVSFCNTGIHDTLAGFRLQAGAATVESDSGSAHPWAGMLDLIMVAGVCLSKRKTPCPGGFRVN
jgi:hypothetical protein